MQVSKPECQFIQPKAFKTKQKQESCVSTSIASADTNCSDYKVHLSFNNENNQYNGVNEAK